jgi:hypothetical protein
MHNKLVVVDNAFAIVDRIYSEADLRETVGTLREMISKEQYLYPLDEDVESLIGQFEEIRSSLIWSPGQVVSRPFSFRGLQ